MRMAIQIHTLPFEVTKRALSGGRAVTAPRLQNSAPAGPLRRRRRAPTTTTPGPGPPRWGTIDGGEWKREERQPLYLAPLAGASSKKSREGRRVAGGPGRRPSQGHVARPGRCRGAPRVGRAAGAEPPGGADGLWAGPRGRPLGPSSLRTWRPRGEGLRPSGPNRGRSGLPDDPSPPPLRPAPATSPSSPRPPRAPALREEEAAAARVPADAPHSFTSRSPPTYSSRTLPLPKTASSPPAGFYRDTGRRLLFSPSTKMAAGPDSGPQLLERVGGQRAGASSSGAIRTTSPRSPCALTNCRQEELAEA
ncbi:hypothetical protein CapIbe_011773, partial [Capra ibex]